MYILYYQLSNNQYRYYNSRYKKLFTKDHLPKRQTGKHAKFSYNKFEMTKGYDASDDGLMSYAVDFAKDCDELGTNPVLKIFYASYYTSPSAVILTFKRLCKGKHEHHEQIQTDEYDWYQKCYNAGLTYCQPGIHDSYGYDYSRFYPLILASDEFKIPTKQGKAFTLKKIPKLSERKYGIYKVKITCDHPDFKKLFMFSKDHTYTHYSINQAKKYQKQFDVKIELICDDKPNTYLYNDEDLVDSSYIFKTWYDTLNSIKELYPNNKLVKHLMSSIWGHLSARNILKITEAEMELDGLDVGMTSRCEWQIYEFHQNSKSEYYELLNSKQPFKYNIRLLPFLTSFARNRISRIAMKDLDNVIRIHTDGVCFKKNPKLRIKNLELEHKTTGLIEWTHANGYKKV